MDRFPTEQQCIDYLETLRWNGTVISPFDTTSKIYFCKKNTYKCRKSGKYFNVKTGTIFHNTKIELRKWFLAIWIVSSENKRINSVALGKELGITQKSAWYMIKRIKLYMKKNDRTFETIKNSPSENIIKVSDKGVKKEDISEKDKLPLLEWLQLLKK